MLASEFPAASATDQERHLAWRSAYTSGSSSTQTSEKSPPSEHWGTCSMDSMCRTSPWPQTSTTGPRAGEVSPAYPAADRHGEMAAGARTASRQKGWSTHPGTPCPERNHGTNRRLGCCRSLSRHLLDTPAKPESARNRHGIHAINIGSKAIMVRVVCSRHSCYLVVRCRHEWWFSRLNKAYEHDDQAQ